MKKNKLIVVGAGIGGIATALRLSKQGYDVTVLEKNDQAGGRLNQIRKDGFVFDTGPSFFSMSYEFKAFFESCGVEVPFEYVALEPLYHVHFRNSTQTFILYKDIEALAQQFKDIEPDFKQKMERYLRKSGAMYRDTVDKVIKNNFDSVLAYLATLIRVNPAHIPQLFLTFWQQVEKHFDSDEARQIISLIAFFLGRTPFDTPSIYTLLSHIEFQHDGYYNVKGGMYKIVEGIVNELNKEQVNLHYNTEIVDFKSDQGKITSLIDQKGNEWIADSYVINADAALFRGKIFKNKAYADSKLRKMNWTMGYLTFYIGVNTLLPEVEHHNYFLGSNFKDYALKVLKQPDVLEKPYYYVNMLSKHNRDCAPPGCESLFFVCPVPNLLHKTNWDDKDIIVDSIIDDFSSRIGMNIRPNIVSRTVYTPIDWENQFHLYKGSGLGLSHHLLQIGAFRPPNYDEQYNNVFYVGASTLPGAGLPMAIIGSQLTSKRVIHYFDTSTNET